MSVNVEFAGCGAVLDGPVCETEPGAELRLWIADRSGARAMVSVDGAPAQIEAAPVDGGLALDVTLPTRLGPLRLEIEDGAARGQWRLNLATFAPAAWHGTATSLRREGKIADGLAAVEGDDAEAWAMRARLHVDAEAWPAADAAFARAIDRAWGTGRVSRAVDASFVWAFSLARRRSAFSRARQILEAARDRAAVYPEGAARLEYGLGLVAREVRDLRASLVHFDAAARRATRLSMSRVLGYVGQARSSSLVALGRADEAIAELDAMLASTPADAICDRARLWSNIGWFRHLAGSAGHSESGASPQNRSASRSAVLPAAPGVEKPFNTRSIPAPSRLGLGLGRQPGTALGPDSVGKLLDGIGPSREAIALYEAGCDDPASEQNARINLALALVGAKRLADARAALDAARAVKSEVDPWLEGWSREVDARLALAGGRPAEALRVFEELAARSAASMSAELGWRAALGRGEALEALERVDEAVEAYRAAERWLADHSLFAPMSEGRETFLGDRARSARALVDLLVRAGRVDEALAAARMARRRGLGSLRRADRLGRLEGDARTRWAEAIGAYRRSRAELDTDAAEDWRFAADGLAGRRAARREREATLRALLDEAFAILADGGDDGPLPAPRSGDLLLAWHPVRDGWIAFAADESGVDAAPIAAPNSARPAAVLAPFRGRIAGARRLVLLPYGPLRAMDLHAAPWGDDALVNTVLSNAVLLNTVPVVYATDLAPLPVRGPPARSAVIVADTRGDLPAARKEADTATAALRGWQIRRFIGPAAKASEVKAALADTAVLHFAGHGVFRGRRGWHSALRLADGAQLGIGDILALPSAPSRVVLSGCETARGDVQAPIETIGLAQAFAVAGADAVVAAVRPVDDGLAGAMSAALYREGFASRPAAELADAVRDAQLSVRRELPGGDWAAFRLLVR